MAASTFRRIACAAALAAGALAAVTPAAAGSIYTCVDGKGRRLTADRPIPDCIDREQTELSPGGLRRRTIGPSLTAEERAAQERQDQHQQEERLVQEEEKRKQRALLARFPNREAHDKERAAALAMVDAVTAAAQVRTKELEKQRKFLDGEFEFYQVDPSKTPLKLRQQSQELDAQLSAQNRFIAEQDIEKVRVNARFDEELSRLKVLWAQQAMPVQPAAASSVDRPAAATFKTGAKH